MVGKKSAWLKSAGNLIEELARLVANGQEETFQEEVLFAFANSSSCDRFSYPSIFRFGMARK
jgi:hypothetical protein